MPYLLDADWVIDVLTGSKRAFDTVDRLAPEGIVISWTTVGEVYEGAFGLNDPQYHLDRYRRLLRPYPIVDLDEPIMERFGALRAMLRRRGDLIPDFDLLLGAIALHHDLTVLTRNTRHLCRIPGLKLYQPL